MPGRPCGIVSVQGRDCPERSVSGSPLNLCARHLRQAAELHASLRDLDPGTRLLGPCPACGRRALVAMVATRSIVCRMCQHTQAVDPQTIPRPDRSRITTGDPVVYYLRFGDRIKIGTTTDLRSRLASLPHDEVLAVERGDRSIESQRHAQFAHLRITRRGEWFRADPDLLAHIDTLDGATTQFA